MNFISVKPDTYLFPLPAALVSCGSVNNPNLITIAWTGTVCSSPPMCYVSIRKERYSHSLIKESLEYVINLLPDSFVEEVDYCGTVSGRNANKFIHTGLTPLKATTVGSSIVGEALVAIECKVVNILELGSHDMFLSEVVGVQVSDKLISADGTQQDFSSLDLIGFTKGWYHSQGRKLLRYGHNKLRGRAI
ncbi:MAG: hypothetical protein A2X11_02130 [Bacteroidetes bacterium GWE2_42_24]|nr:MAG: hypothetical protein A2X11_02130 [Bacteroidetes bacterium GWE2_42_24]OFY29077.1 MAG: hypothetical protein A2X09_16080 [Bacteroidetes bacterium GWF2_43_11]